MAKVCVIGGGAAGMMAAYYAAINGAEVTLYERNDNCGKKLNITGKGRCNLTNLCDIQTFLQNVPVNPRFLYKALNNLTPEDTMTVFESLGVPLKVERGRRVFPISDRAADITAAMYNACTSAGVKVIHNRVRGINVKDGVFEGVRLSGGREAAFDACIVATGGASYPKTGSDGDGYRFAKEAGHSIVPLKPSLVPLCAAGSLCKRLMGLSLKNVKTSFYSKEDKLLYSEQGEMLFTHFGISGPLVLSASAHLGDAAGVKVQIDLKPALDFETLDKRLLRDFEENRNRDFCNSLGALLPQKLIPVIVEQSGIEEHKKVNSITKEERKRLAELIKGIRLTLTGKRPIDEAIVTSGGVTVTEINPSTMESKLTKGLFFAGEVIDVDAYTGGYNLQIAFATGALAGTNAAYTE